MNLLVLPGDGIGPEITAATLDVLRAVSERFDLRLQIEEAAVGHAGLRAHGSTIHADIVEKARRAEGVVLGPTSTFEFKDPARGEINPSMILRKSLDLFANIRPARTYAGFPLRCGEFDLVVARENTEGFYADRNMEAGSGEILVTKDVAISLRRITRACSERIARVACELAVSRRKRVTIVHKANVLKVTDGLFIESCHKVAKEFPAVTIDDVIVDAMMAHVVRNPQRFDVIVTTNMYGDILSDLTAELSGSLGLAASLNAGTDHGMAQAAWLGARYCGEECSESAVLDFVGWDASRLAWPTQEGQCIPGCRGRYRKGSGGGDCRKRVDRRYRWSPRDSPNR